MLKNSRVRWCVLEISDSFALMSSISSFASRNSPSKELKAAIRLWVWEVSRRVVSGVLASSAVCALSSCSMGVSPGAVSFSSRDRSSRPRHSLIASAKSASSSSNDFCVLSARLIRSLKFMPSYPLQLAWTPQGAQTEVLFYIEGSVQRLRAIKRCRAPAI